MFYPLESRIYPKITIRRERLLPRPGEVLVRTGDTVAAIDVLGHTCGNSRWHYINVAAQLKVAPEAVESCLEKKIGETVQKDEIIASARGSLGLFRRVCKAPTAGKLVALLDGRALLEELGESFELRALLRGKIAGVMAGYGAVIETKGVLLKMAWGAGQSTYGVLKVMAGDPATCLQLSQIDIGCHGAIIVAGSCDSGDVLRQADQMQARGIVIGSVPADVRALALQLRVPIVVTEGFGSIPMNTMAFNLFHAHNGREAAMMIPQAADGGNGENQPEIIIPLGGDEAFPMPQLPTHLETGRLVRLLGYPRPGAVGRITSIPDLPRPVESGELYRGVEIETEAGETLFAPWSNVEPLSE